MKVLIACEFSGIVREEFRKLGHDAWSCDLLPSEIEGQHILGDVLNILNDGWDLMIAHPPCTYLCNSGVRWLKDDPIRQACMKDACWFFNQILNAQVSYICVENPIPHKYAKNIIGPYSQLIQPWQFGHGETKATCLWLKNLPPLMFTNIVEGRSNKIHHSPDSKDRWKRRSRTYQGIAKAMAQQWSKYASGRHKQNNDNQT